MRSDDITFLFLTVALPIVITELVLFGCARIFGDGKAYTWYSCALRVFAYSPCLIGASHSHGIMPMPVPSALLLHLRGDGGDIVWLYGVPELFVGVCCYFISFAIRTNSTTESARGGTESASNPVGTREET